MSRITSQLQTRVDTILHRARTIQTATTALVDGGSVPARDDDLIAAVYALIDAACGAVDGAASRDDYQQLHDDSVFAEINLDYAVSVLGRVRQAVALGKMKADAERITHVETHARVH